MTGMLQIKSKEKMMIDKNDDCYLIIIIFNYDGYMLITEFSVRIL